VTQLGPPHEPISVPMPDTQEPALMPLHDANRIVYLAFTSGTTGEPKGVMHSSNTLLSPVRAMVRDWSFDSSSRIYSLSPLSHNLGFGAMILALSIGAELTIHDLPRSESVARRLRETKATFVFGVPAHAFDLLAELETDGVDGVPDVRGFRISGASVPPALVHGLMQRGVTPQSGFGMTEAGSHHYTLPDDPPEVIAGSSGKPFDGYEVRIFDQENPDRELSTGEVGEVAGRGASLMLGYFDNQAATESSFNKSGWFLTGDLGQIDDAGNLTITGRKKDVIVRGGHKIFPVKIESMVLRHAAIARCAVLPVPDERLGEKVCLVVELQPDMALKPAELLTHLENEGLSRYDMPEYLAEVPAIPLTASGKIFKRQLASWIESGSVTPAPIRFAPSS
jgi:acyl-CoA synthetase (AMP-forming)/AMP-acid ligase II